MKFIACRIAYCRKRRAAGITPAAATKYGAPTIPTGGIHRTAPASRLICRSWAVGRPQADLRDLFQWTACQRSNPDLRTGRGCSRQESTNWSSTGIGGFDVHYQKRRQQRGLQLSQGLDLYASYDLPVRT